MTCVRHEKNMIFPLSQGLMTSLETQVQNDYSKQILPYQPLPPPNIFLFLFVLNHWDLEVFITMA